MDANLDPMIPRDETETVWLASAGVAVSLLIWGERVTWKVAVAAMISGLGLAYTSANLVSAWLFTDPGAIGLVSFIIGLTGLTITTEVLRFARGVRIEIVQLLRRIFGRT